MTRPRDDFVRAQRRMLGRYGVEAESRLVDVPSLDGQAHTLVTGDGPIVVMVNGLGCPAAMWAPLMAELEGVRLVAVDLPGFGLTDAGPGPWDRDPREGAVRFLVQALDGLELDRPAFVANSMGSLWTIWLALDRPERVGAMVHVGCPAVVLGTSAPLPMRLLSVRPLGRLLTRLRPPSPGQVEQLARMVNEHPLVPELVDLLVATERLPGYRRTFLSLLQALLRLGGSRPDHRLTAGQLSRVARPTVLVWGKDDPFGSPEVGEEMVERMPDAELHVVDGGHAPWLREGERIGRIVSPFLQRERRAG